MVMVRVRVRTRVRVGVRVKVRVRVRARVRPRVRKPSHVATKKVQAVAATHALGCFRSLFQSRS